VKIIVPGLNLSATENSDLNYRVVGRHLCLDCGCVFLIKDADLKNGVVAQKKKNIVDAGGGGGPVIISSFCCPNKTCRRHIEFFRDAS